MKAYGYVYTQGDILIEPYKFEKILNLKIIREINEHSKLYLSGIVSDEYDTSDKCVEYANESSSIKISVKDDNGQIKDLFYGMISTISVKCVDNVKTLEIEALSNTCKLDIEKKCRSFQGNGITYRSIFDAIKSVYGSVTMIDYISAGRTIDTMIVQYYETDWEFLKRLASHFNAAVIPECRLDGIKYSIGKGEGSALYTLDQFDYSVTKGIKEYRIKSAQGIADDDNNFVSYEFTTNLVLDLYNTVHFKDRYLSVYKCEMNIVNGILANTYTLRDEKAMKIRKYYNDKLSGASLDGKIVSCKNDVVKIALKIDAYSNTEGSNTEWVPYSTVFSSPDGTGWYCMPEVGDAIRLYFPDSDEKNGYAISSVNLESSNAEKRSDPSVKSLGTKYGKEIVMSPGAINVISSNNSMTLTDGGGISINSDSQIVMSAPSIDISGGDVTIEGTNQVKISKKDGASITITNDIDMSGSKINTQ